MELRCALMPIPRVPCRGFRFVSSFPTMIPSAVEKDSSEGKCGARVHIGDGPCNARRSLALVEFGHSLRSFDDFGLSLGNHLKQKNPQ